MNIFSKIARKIRYELQFHNTSYRTRIVDRFFKETYSFFLRIKIRSLPPIKLEQESPKLTLAMLANKKKFYESVAALYSFCYWHRNIYLHYHEDGTLTEKEVRFLRKIFPGIKVFLRSEQNAKMKELLLTRKLENCVKLREVFFLSIRLFDMIIEKKTPYLLHIDSDVLFFSSPAEIMDIIEKCNYNGCYNLDVQNAYTFDNDTISKYLTSKMMNRVNSGLFMHNFDEVFFGFINKVLEGNLHKTDSWHLEQTLFAMYASEKGSFLDLPKYYDLGRRERNIGNKITSEHYVHGTGYDFHKDFIYKLVPLFSK